MPEPKKKKKKPNSLVSDVINNVTENTTQKKKKRKLDEETQSSDLVDSDAETTPKKIKLSQNEQNAAARIKSKIKSENVNSAEYKDRTVFVGNIPINALKSTIKKHFRKYGKISTLEVAVINL